MKRIIYMVIFTLFSLTLQAEEFIVYQIQSKNIILKAIATRLIRNKANNRIKISVKGDTAYISTSHRCIEFYQTTEKNNRFYYKKRKAHIAKLFIDETIDGKEAYFILEENGKRKIKVSLTQL